MRPAGESGVGNDQRGGRAFLGRSMRILANAGVDADGRVTARVQGDAEDRVMAPHLNAHLQR